MFAPIRSRVAVGSLSVSHVCLGIVGSSDVVRAAYEAGVNFFAVTTDMHWPVYDATRRGLVELLRDRPAARDEIVVMGVSYVTHPRFCHAPFVELLEAVPSLGRLDISCMGAATNDNFLGRWDAHTKHREDSRIGAHAVAAIFDDAVAARAALAGGLVDLAVVGYRPSHRRLRSELFDKLSASRRAPILSIGVALDVLPPTRLQELGVGKDQWLPTLGDYVRYSIGVRCIDGLLCNAATVGELTEILHAAEGGPLTPEEAVYLEDLSDLHRGLAELVT